jgi:hypothetical protein
MQEHVGQPRRAARGRLGCQSAQRCARSQRGRCRDLRVYLGSFTDELKVAAAAQSEQRERRAGYHISGSWLGVEKPDFAEEIASHQLGDAPTSTCGVPLEDVSGAGDDKEQVLCLIALAHGWGACLDGDSLHKRCEVIDLGA